MTRENAKKLQSMMAKEAVTLLMLGGAEADRAEHEEAIRLIGEAWGLAEEETARQIERIGHGRQSVRMGAENMPPDEGDVPLVLTGREVIELERELFETAVRLNDRDKRQQLFNTAQAAAEWFSLEDWITGTQEESGHRMSMTPSFSSSFLRSARISASSSRRRLASRFWRSACPGDGAPAAFSQLRSVSMQMPSSAATSRLGRPCSVTIRTAPALKASS